LSTYRCFYKMSIFNGSLVSHNIQGRFGERIYFSLVWNLFWLRKLDNEFFLLYFFLIQFENWLDLLFSFPYDRCLLNLLQNCISLQLSLVEVLRVVQVKILWNYFWWIPLRTFHDSLVYRIPG
jgi:hypothetical protein